MVIRFPPFKCAVAAFVILQAVSSSAVAQTADLDTLFLELKDADESSHERISNEIRLEWQKSGSAAMDLLLRRGTEALEEGNALEAAEHFSALIDHAPEFTEGYHGRASAYFANGLMGPAIDDLRQTLVLMPRHYEAMFGLASIMEGLERPEDALEVHELILEIYPLNQMALDAKARLEEQLRGQSL